MEFNNLSAGDTLANFVAFYVAPCRHSRDCWDETEGGHVIQTDAENREFWGIYGIEADGCSMAVHDAEEARDLAAALAEIAKTGRPLSYQDDKRGVVPEGTLAALADRLAELIHDDIPGYDDPADFRDDDFDAHPLAELREAIQELDEHAAD